MATHILESPRFCRCPSKTPPLAIVAIAFSNCQGIRTCSWTGWIGFLTLFLT